MKFLFVYASRDGVLQKLNPVTKFIIIFTSLVVLFEIHNPLALAGALLSFIVLLHFGAKVSVTEYWQLIAIFTPFFLIVILIQGLVYQPPDGVREIVFQAGSLAISLEGIIRGLEIAFRLVTMAVAFLIFSMTTTPEQIELSLTNMGVPYRGAYLIGFALRFVELIQEEANDLMSALRIRGYDLNVMNPIHGIKMSWQLVPPLLISSLRRSSNIALAMELRLWSTAEKRTPLKSLRARPIDYALISASIVLLVGILLRNVLGS